MEAVPVHFRIVAAMPVGHGVSYLDSPEKTAKTSAAQSLTADPEVLHQDLSLPR